MSNQAPEAARFETPKYAWVVLIGLYLASLTATLNMFKLPPVMTTLLEGTLGLGYEHLGTLMSTFSIMGFLLAIPAGFILKRFGIKPTVLFAVATVGVGATIGALADSYNMMYIGRFIEGTGMGLVMVASPLTISMWFPMHNRALPTGLWATCVGIGNIAPLIFAPGIAVAHGWQSIWWGGVIFAAVAFVFFAIAYRDPRPDEMEAPPAPPPAPAGEPAPPPPSFFEALRNVNYYLIGIGFGTYNLVILALVSFLPTFLEDHRGYARVFDGGNIFMVASIVTALVMLASVFTAPLGGYISDRLGKRKAVALSVYAIMTLSMVFAFHYQGWQIPVFMIVFGVFGGPIAAALLAAVPEVSKAPQLIGFGMAIVAVCQNLGMFIGPTLFMAIVTASSGGAADPASWQFANYMMLPICIVGMLCIWRIKVR